MFWLVRARGSRFVRSLIRHASSDWELPSRIPTGDPHEHFGGRVSLARNLCGCRFSGGTTAAEWEETSGSTARNVSRGARTCRNRPCWGGAPDDTRPEGPVLFNLFAASRRSHGPHLAQTARSLNSVEQHDAQKHFAWTGVLNSAMAASNCTSVLAKGGHSGTHFRTTIAPDLEPLLAPPNQ